MQMNCGSSEVRTAADSEQTTTTVKENSKEKLIEFPCSFRLHGRAFYSYLQKTYPSQSLPSLSLFIASIHK